MLSDLGSATHAKKLGEISCHKHFKGAVHLLNDAGF